MNLKKCKSVFCVFSVLLIFVLSACSRHSENDGNILKLIFLDVGKADCIIIKTANHAILVDTGTQDDGTRIIECLKENNIEALDYMIITHFDKDHVGGAGAVIDSITVKNVIQPDYEKDSAQCREYASSLKNAGIEKVALTDAVAFILDTVEFTVYPPQKASYNKENNFSLVTSIKHGENSFLLAGDAMAERLDELIGAGSLEHSLLKVPHHGAYNKNSDDFFKSVNARYAIITCSKENPASEKTVSALKKAGAKVYLTQNGDIYCTSDGASIQIRQQTH